MGKIIIITFAFMAFAFYELSGGDEFIPIADEKRAMLAEQEKATLIAEAKLKAEREEKLIASGVIPPKPSQPATAGLVLASAVVPAAPEVESAEVQAAVVAALDTDKAETVTEEVAETDEAPAADIREVTAARVNMRGGPGQNFAVLAKLSAGDQVEIMQDPGDGWVKLRTIESGRVGWMADFLLTAANN